MKTAQQGSQNWKDSQGRATQAYSDGVAAYNGDWAGATVAQEQTLRTNVLASIDNGSWRRGVTAVGTQGWKTQTEAKKGNYGTGFTAGAPKQAIAMQKIMTALGNIVPNLPARGDFTANKQRMIGLVDALHAQRGTLGAA